MDEVLFSRDSGIGRITINRPEKSNALNRSVINRLHEILNDAAHDDAIRAITLTGAGERAFCAGADLKAAYLAAADGEGFNRTEFRQLLVDLVQFPKPTITLVRGHVMGGGLGLVLASDLSLACEDVYLSTPEIQVGMFPMMIMALLYRNVGRKKATELMFLGERITAGQAEAFGIINHVFRRDLFETTAEEFVQKIAVKSAAILRLGKEALSGLLDESLTTEEKYLEAALAEVMSTEDSKEGLRAFIEKRPPRWN